jgi:hypothetical protein
LTLGDNRKVDFSAAMIFLTSNPQNEGFGGFALRIE